MRRGAGGVKLYLKPSPAFGVTFIAMKAHTLVLAALFLVTLSSCYVTPRRAPLSPGGRAIAPIERHDRSVLSPGGRVITPRERAARRHGVGY